jgi:hypothetical protein
LAAAKKLGLDTRKATSNDTGSNGRRIFVSMPERITKTTAARKSRRLSEQSIETELGEINALRPTLPRLSQIRRDVVGLACARHFVRNQTAISESETHDEASVFSLRFATSRQRKPSPPSRPSLSASSLLSSSFSFSGN